MNLDYVLNCFPKQVKQIIENALQNNEISNLEEIRIRNKLPIILKLGQAEKMLNYKIATEDINFIFQKICENSIYSYQNQITNGFITIQGGNRVGIVGTAVIKEGKITNFNYISSLNFRISRQVIGCSNTIIDKIINYPENTIYNTLIVASPRQR